MTLTKQQKLLAGVLGLGVVVFAVDRVFLGAGPAPDQATAASHAVKTTASAAAPDQIAAAARVDVTPNDQSIARRLARYAEATALDPVRAREAFVPSEAWVPREMEKAPAASAVLVPRRDPREVFRDRHRLGAIAGNGDSAIAIVDGMPIRLGQTYDGFTLVEVTQRGAVFASGAGAGRVELRLKP